MWHVTTVDQTGSTNADLMSAARAGAPSGSVLRAVEQTAGRGRRGSVWIGRADGSLAFSVLWRFNRPVTHLSGLSLAVGVAVVQALDQLGFAGAKLKWPNDVVIGFTNAQGYAKLAGILVEVQGDATQCVAVIGMGLNIDLGALMPELAANATDLRRWRGTAPLPSPDTVMQAILTTLGPTLTQFQQEGFAPFQAQWEARHLFTGQEVVLREEGQIRYSGVAEGVDATGALRLRAESGEERVVAGDVSLRLA
jgi:BirA family transcriptional regulator, biotin operon repressor / biotin---[acetyl-CoA-carboxylase] ligase